MVGEGLLGRESTRDMCRAGLAWVRGFCALMLVVVLYDLVFVVVFQGGTRFAVPRTIRAQELASLELQMSKSDRQLVEGAFSNPNSSGIRTYCGRPSDLAPHSRLSQVLAHALCSRASVSPSMVTAARMLCEEYAAQGYDAADLRLKAGCSAVRSLVGCLAVMWASGRQLGILDGRGQSRRRLRPLA